MTHLAAPPTVQASMPSGLVALFAASSGVSVANVYYAQPLLDLMAADFGIPVGAAGAIVTATQVGSALALLLLVPLGDRMPRRRLMLMQLGVLCVALLCAASARSAAFLVGAMLVVGMLGTAMTQGLIAYAATAAAAGERGRVVGATQGGVVTGLLLARVLAGGIADLAGWRAMYLVSAAAMLGIGVLLWWRLPPQPAPVRPLPYGLLIRSMLALLRDERVLQIRGGIAFLMFAAFGIFWSALVLPLSAPPYGMSHTAIGAFGLAGVVGVLAASRAGRLADRGLGQRTSGAALALLVLAWVPLGLALTPSLALGMPARVALLALGIVALDLAVQALQVLNQSMIFAVRPEAHSRVVGCYMMFYAAGSGLGAVAGTAMYAVGGWAGVCLLGAGVGLAALAFWRMTRHWTA
ncbi:MFS transporter [Pseudoduganella plicata]|uniref:MFS transporter n=1 Tax=Pseudoduganella plicata TaxID=321984 RepID=A0A4P7BEZ0_9BURK|nr:MFS transporter [Pseudoduganella plicata]QBQ36075.1 MFS transporter [Pseudoduganella plicata]GGY78292.1 MFS transporter [Pseudoduganella plicata]